jgi:hypothetical protein
MGITQKSIKILWAAAGGRCGFDGCWEQLCFHEADEAAPYTLGEMAHIRGDKLGSNRHDPDQTDTERDDYQNLFLLCPTHHRRIDRKENETVYSVEILSKMKARHEERVLERLDNVNQPTKTELARLILQPLEENRQSWLQYGPMSDLARSEPHNYAARAVWLSERLSIVIPNNRKIAKLLNEHKAQFDAGEQGVIAAFLLHVRSYEKWVDDSIPYTAVKRFPAEFDELIRRVSDARTQR